MRQAQRALAQFLPFINWQVFNRKNWNHEITLSSSRFTAFGCGNEAQAIVWLLQTDRKGKRGMLPKGAQACSLEVTLPMAATGHYLIITWDTVSGSVVDRWTIHHQGQKKLCIPVIVNTADVAFAIVRSDQSS